MATSGNNRKLGGVHGAVVVTVPAVRMVEVAVHQVINVIAMGHGFMAAVRAMPVALFMSAAEMIRRASYRVVRIDGQPVLIDMVAVRRMEMPVVQIVHVVVVHDCRVSAVFAVHMRMVFVDFVVAHASTFILGRGGWAVKPARRRPRPMLGVIRSTARYGFYRRAIL